MATGLVSDRDQREGRRHLVPELHAVQGASWWRLVSAATRTPPATSKVHRPPARYGIGTAMLLSERWFVEVLNM